MNPSESKADALKIGEEQIGLLERLCNAVGVSGDESAVRKIVLEQVRAARQDKPGEIKVDPLGNVLVSCPAEGGPEEGKRLRVMVAAHMDEVGFMLVQNEDKGFFRFDLVGGIDLRQIPGKPVVVGKERIPGIVGAKAIHLTQGDETRRTMNLDSLKIDVGSNGGKVKVGDRATFATQFTRLGPSLLAKALDNRLGVAILIELVKNPPANVDLLAAFTVQEEIGARGAQVAAYAFNPDLAIALDSTPAYDQPVWDESSNQRLENPYYNTRLGAGPALYIADRGTLTDPRLFRFFIDTAEAEGIPYQVRQPGGGGTDASVIHRQRAGIPSISVSVPSRYQHTAASIGRIDDWQNTLALLSAALHRLSPDVLSSERA